MKWQTTLDEVNEITDMRELWDLVGKVNYNMNHNPNINEESNIIHNETTKATEFLNLNYISNTKSKFKELLHTTELINKHIRYDIITRKKYSIRSGQDHIQNVEKHKSRNTRKNN